MRKFHMAIAACAAVIAAGTAATLPLHGQAGVGTTGIEAGGGHALALGGIATVVHQDGDGNVLGEQVVHNALLDGGEDFILQQVFMNGESADDTAQIGAICLSATPDATITTAGSITETLTASQFNSNHNAADGTFDPAVDSDTQTLSTIDGDDTVECLTDSTVSNSTQVATVGPLIFTANNTEDASNWKPSIAIKNIGICQGSSTTSCTAPLFAVVDINDVTLGIDETLTVTYTFDMSSDGT